MMEATTLSEDLGPEKQPYDMSEFMEYMSSHLSVLPSDPPNYYVFCFPHQSDADLPPPPAALPPQTNNPSSTTTSQGATSLVQPGIGERIKRWLQSLTWFFWDSLLIQFWEPTIIGGRRFLTTSRQPFALKTLYRGPCWYRKHCTNHDILVDEGADEEGFGPLGRAFRSGQPESSPDLRLYSIKEYPLRDHALRCGLRRYMALPVFELQPNSCVGLLELVSFNSEMPLVYFDFSHHAFQGCNLSLRHTDGPSDTQTEGRKLALSEIKQMFKVVNETPNIPLALAWLPRPGCSGNCNCMQQALFAYDPEWNKQYELINNDFLQACLFHRLQQGKGVAGRALSSTHGLCFCRSIYGFNITEYPLAHYARKAMLSISFAICLQSDHTGSDLYVLEFFMLPGSQDAGDPRSLIQSLLVRMARQLLSFKVASGQRWGEELLVEILRFRLDDELVYFVKSPSDGYPLGFKVSAPDYPAEAKPRSPSERSHTHSPMQIAGGDADSSAEAGKTSAAIIATALRAAEEASESDRKVSSFQISYQDLKSHFGKPQKEAANILGVSVSKFKRACRSHNITRWPSHIRNKANHSLFEVKLPEKPGDQDAGLSRATHSRSSPSTCSITGQDRKLVTVKANYQSKAVKFQVYSSSGIAELEEQVAKRLKLKIGSFEMSYEDEDGIQILLTCDEDLWLCSSTNSLAGSAAIQLSVTSA